MTRSSKRHACEMVIAGENEDSFHETDGRVFQNNWLC